MSSKLPPIPTFKGKTLIGLLRAVQRVIRQEPRRVNMNYFCESFRDASPTDAIYHSASLPACKTVGCFSGWINLLAGASPNIADVGGASLSMELLGSNLDFENIVVDEDKGHRLLGDDDDIDELEISGRLCADVFNAGDYDITDSPGSPAYAEQVARRIDAFIAVNRKRLGNRRLRRSVITKYIKDHNLQRFDNASDT